MHMYHDPSLSEDLRNQMTGVLERIPREGNEADETLIRAALTSREKPVEKVDSPDTNHGKKIVDTLQGKLEDFLKYYESESEEEEEACTLTSSMQQSVRDMTPEFQCCVCHSSLCELDEDIPCLLVHEDNFCHPSGNASTV